MFKVSSCKQFVRLLALLIPLLNVIYTRVERMRECVAILKSDIYHIESE